MAHIPMPNAAHVRVAAILTLPAAVVLAALWIGGLLEPVSAATALIAAYVGTLLVVAPLLRWVRSLRGYVRLFDGAPPDEPPWLGENFLGRDLAAATQQLDRAWRRRNAETARALALTETLLDSLPDPLLLIDADQIIIRANRAAQALLGDDLTDQRLPRRVRIPALLAAADGTCADGQPRQAEFTLPGPTPRHLVAHLEPLPATGQRGSSALMVALHDLTQMKRGEQLRVDFVANASHEIRTPLAAIIGLIETVRGPARDDPEATERFLAAMADHGQRISRLVEDLLSLSRIELSVHQAPTDPVSIDSVIERTRAALEWRAGERRITVDLDTGTALPEVIGDAGELDQVFYNLLDNAIKYAPEGSVARITARVSEPPNEPTWPRDRGALAITVEDQGVGISAEHLPRLTERFYRVDKGRSRAVGGTGLGLAIVKHIVSRHRGYLDIRSTPGKGSRFTVYLPTALSANETKPS